MVFDFAEWKKNLNAVLKENPDISRATGMIEINLGEGGIGTIYFNKRVKNASEASAVFEQMKDKVESGTVRIKIG